MKFSFITKAIITALILSWPSSSAELLPADHDICLAPKKRSMITCIDGATFLRGHDGRCGCLLPEEYLHIKSCGGLECYRDSPLSLLFQGRKLVGCGCFKVW